MSDLRKPGNPGGTKGPSLTPYVAAPISEDSDESKETANGFGSGPVAPVTPGKTSGRKGNPIR